MNLFVKTKSLKFDNQEVLVKEVGVNYLLLDEETKQDTKKVLQLHTNLSDEQVDNLSIEAFNHILNEFYKLNEIHFSQDNKGEDGGK